MIKKCQDSERLKIIDEICETNKNPTYDKILRKTLENLL